MKKLFLILFCLLLSALVFAQNITLNAKLDELKVTPPKFTAVINNNTYDQMTTNELLTLYFSENLQCPASVKDQNIEGTELISFVVTSEGNITDIEILNSVCRAADEEMSRVLATTNGMWQPAMKDEKPVAMEHEIALFIHCSDNPGNIGERFKEKATASFLKGCEKLIIQQKPRRALASFNQGVKYLPYEKNLLFMRGLAYYELGKTEAARRDWNRIVSMGGIDFTEIAADFSHMKGYGEVSEMLMK